MAVYFACLSCGAVSKVEEPLPKCARCGSATGVARQENPARAAAPDTGHARLRRASATQGAARSSGKPELLLLEERCLDGESRCEERADAARRRGDYATVAFEVQLKEQYRRLRLKMRDRRDYDSRPEEGPDAQRLRGRSGEQPASRDEESPG